MADAAGYAFLARDRCAPGRYVAEPRNERPSRHFYEGYKGDPVVPRYPTLQVEPAGVIDDLLYQVLEVVELAHACERSVKLKLSLPVPPTTQGTDAT